MLFLTTQLRKKHNLNNNELFRVMYNGEVTETVNMKNDFGNSIFLQLKVFANLNILHPVKSGILR